MVKRWYRRVSYGSKGECWWLDVSLPHQVDNNSDEDRVHLVVDIYNNDTIQERYFQ